MKMDEFQEWIIYVCTEFIALLAFSAGFGLTQNKKLITPIVVSVAVIIVEAVSELISELDDKKGGSRT